MIYPEWGLIDGEEWAKLEAAQGPGCALCGREKALEVDHCHEDGMVRGLLCHGCNLALGFYERPAVEQLAARPAWDEYLRHERYCGL